MVDGTGMCGACRVTVDGKTKFVCVDGPEFDAHGVDWNEMLSRMKAFKAEEAAALEAYRAHVSSPNQTGETLSRENRIGINTGSIRGKNVFHAYPIHIPFISF
jgi:hypothetical protein